MARGVLSTSAVHPHFAAAHFAIALAITGAGLVLVGSIRRAGDSIRSAGVLVCCIAAVASVATVASGLWLASQHADPGESLLSAHRLLGLGTAASGLMALGSHLLRYRISNVDVIRNLLFVTFAVLAGATGVVGGEMAHGDPQEPARSEHLH